MVTKIVVGYVTLTFLLIFILGFYIFVTNFSVDNSNKKFQGPVPDGYDEDYFRETGLTIPKQNGFKLNPNLPTFHSVKEIQDSSFNFLKNIEGEDGNNK